MEHPSHSKPSKLSAFKARLHAHFAIARSLSPFCTHAVRLDSTSNYAVPSFLAISSCMCSSSSATTSAIIDAQVPTCLRDADNVRHIEHGSLHGNLKGKHVSKTKKRFSGSFNKSNARVSDVSAGSPCRMRHSLVSSKSDDKVIKLLKYMQDETEGYGRSNPHSPCKSLSDNYAVMGVFDGRDSESSTPNKPAVQVYSCKREKLGMANFTEVYLPEVRYTYDPCKAFYKSMLHMVMVRCLDVYDVYEYNLEDMCACYLMLNSSHHHQHIEEAFRKLLTDLYKSKVLKIGGVDSCGETAADAFLTKESFMYD